jgi:hypothetical protein
MGIMNRRNAALGWTVLQVGKRIAKKKARNAVPSARTGLSAVAGVSALAGALFLWLRRRGGGSESE